jgi:hypothetical protein
MMISQTIEFPPYSFLDWFKKDIAVTLIKYGYELDTAFYDWLFPIRLHMLKPIALSLYINHRKVGILYDSSRY